MSDLSWASAALQQRIQADPVAVLRDRGINPPEGMPLADLYEFISLSHRIWVDGHVVTLEDFRIDPMDEGLLFGRGVWESTRTSHSEPWLWDLHVDRLLQSAEVLGIALTADRVPSSQAVTQFVQQLTAQDVVVRLNVSAGRAGQAGLVWMSLAPMIPRPERLRLRTVRNPVSKNQPYLLLKTFQYATRLRIAQEVTASGYDTALLVDEHENLLEAAQANLFVRLPNGWFTPPADGGLLPGIVRHVLLTGCPMKIAEGPISAQGLPNIREAFVTNSNLGIIPVTQIDGFTLPIGAETEALMKWLEPPISPSTKYLFQNKAMPKR